MGNKSGKTTDTKPKDKEPQVSPLDKIKSSRKFHNCFTLVELSTVFSEIECWSHQDVILLMTSDAQDSDAAFLRNFITKYSIDGTILKDCWIRSKYFDTNLVSKCFSSEEEIRHFENMLKRLEVYSAKELSYHDPQKYPKEYADSKPSDELAAERRWEEYKLPSEPLELVTFYHEVTKNSKGKAARSLPRQWFSQPHSNRRFIGSPVLKLPTRFDSEKIEKMVRSSYKDLFDDSKLDPLPITIETISYMLYYSLARSGQSDESRTMTAPRSSISKRCNASSGGLHPVDAYLVFHSQTTEGDAKQSFRPVAHYCPSFHGLELLSKNFVNTSGDFNEFFLVINSVNWREIWKYGERGFRYSQLDIGHAWSSVMVACELLGWKADLVNSISDENIASFVGLNQFENSINKIEVDNSGLILRIHRGSNSSEAFKFDEILNAQLPPWTGLPLWTSYSHTVWDILSRLNDTVVRKEGFIYPNFFDSCASVNPELKATIDYGKLEGTFNDLRKVIRKRRSALDFAPGPKISLSMLKSLMLRTYQVNRKFNLGLSALGMLVMQVEEIKSGHYIYALSDDARKAYSDDTDHFQEVDDIPLLFEIKKDSVTPQETTNEIAAENTETKKKEDDIDPILKKLSEEAHGISCNQNIAKHSAVTLSMFCDLGQALNLDLCYYRDIHWSCGFLGQILYLECSCFTQFRVF
jgi:SagB-type dehydrogenase family enzyme